MRWKKTRAIHNKERAIEIQYPFNHIKPLNYIQQSFNHIQGLNRLILLLFVSCIQPFDHISSDVVGGVAVIK